jgi:tRNA (guanine37-N1)-methyltransferase
MSVSDIYIHMRRLLTCLAHLNLRSQYLPFKTLIATVIIDKNPAVKTVINKIDTVGEESEYRTFSYEVLAGNGNMNVSLTEQNCVFEFDYSKVYWNSRLNTEHERLVQSFKPGEAVCDVMAGIGPFAIPAGKKKSFVWANDLNPESYKYLESGIQKNKVSDFVQPFNENGHTFIRTATKQLYENHHSVTIRPKVSRSQKDTSSNPPPTNEVIVQPKTFSDFVMNLPASAITFLPSFIGLYHQAGIPEGLPLPKIHVYCFGLKSDDNQAESERLRDEVSSLLKFKFALGDEHQEGQLSVYDVRDVAPTKRMFCISFRLPSEVAHRSSS